MNHKNRITNRIHRTPRSRLGFMSGVIGAGSVIRSVGPVGNMSDPATFGAFRMQAYRLAWLTTYALFGVVVLMWVMPHRANAILAEFGIALLVVEGVFSILARRFAPFAWALVGFVLLVGSICA